MSPIKTPTPREAMILRCYDQGVYDSPSAMSAALGLGNNYALTLDAFRPKWRAEPWRNPVRWHINRVSRLRGEKPAAWSSQVLRRFAEMQAGKPITPALLDEWMASLSDKTPASRNRWCSCMRKFIRDIDAMSWLPEPLDKYLTILQEVPEPPRTVRVLSQDELKQLLSTAAKLTHARGLCVFLLASLSLGTRPGETLILKAGMIRPTRSLVAVPRFKRSKPRLASYKWSPTATEMFNMLAERYDDNELICKGAKTTSGWRRLLKEAGLDDDIDRRVLRATARSAYSESAQIAESYLRRMFGHTTETADKHYIDDAETWGEGATIDEWLGCGDQMQAVLSNIRRTERIGVKHDPIHSVQSSEPAQQGQGVQTEVAGRSEDVESAAGQAPVQDDGGDSRQVGGDAQFGQHHQAPYGCGPARNGDKRLLA